MARPVIGLTSYRQPAAWGVWDRDAAFVPATYVDVVARAGGQPVLIPPVGERPSDRHGDIGSDGALPGIEALCRVLDGLVLVGGGDLEPEQYGQTLDPRTAGTSAARDRLELDLLPQALGHGIPILAVCRGLQVLNVALGGDLVQHLPDHTGSDAHLPRPGTFGPVVVMTEAGSHVRRLCGEVVDVICHHHQGVGRLGAGLRVTGRSADGVVEAVELDGYPFVVGVQWHPEEPGDVRLFEGLVEASRRPSGRAGAPTPESAA